MSHPAFKLRYPFDPVPTRARHALRDGLIDLSDYALLGVLYGRADRDRPDLRDENGRRYFPTRATLARLAEELGWEKSPDWLSKHLRKLRADGWLDYRTSGRSHARYDFLLFPDAPGPVQSESSPSRNELGSPSREDALTTVRTGLAQAGGLEASESPKGPVPYGSPRRPLASPSREQAGRPLGQRDSASPVQGVSPSPPDSQEEKSFGEGWRSRGAVLQNEGDEPGKKLSARDELENEVATMREVGELVKSGALVRLAVVHEEEPRCHLCRRPVSSRQGAQTADGRWWCQGSDARRCDEEARKRLGMRPRRSA